MKLSNLLFAAFIIFTTSATFAQDGSADTNEKFHTVKIEIPEVALLDLESSKSTSITLKGTASLEAGEAVEFNATNSEIWINYSSIVGSTINSSRTVSVKITDGAVPAGLELTVLAAADAGNGDGTMGTAVTTATPLTTSSSNIINGIGSAYTGDGVNNGHKLTYTLTKSTTTGAYAKLKYDDTDTLTITYTLSDD